MKKRLVTSVLALAVAAAAFAGILAGQHGGANRRDMVQAKEKAADTKDDMQKVQQFGYELLGQYLKEENPVMSPVSAYMTLGMVADGAKGTTKKEFDKVLGSSSLALAESMMQTLPQKK